ncbi:hypothetical protein [Mesorhizobium sp.]|uniref:hypothetical protein n=1 Tax=Mesorhizobium sp. TaxID=1871066 RepID=UPI000FE8326F|nr:hypothetical protein [Mesorhizobium sp.]RWN35780.1 MAG: hypothetical protein EOR95_12320 [Mesorhizobium sp.]
MMLGIAAQLPPAGSSGDVPEGAVIFLDFVNSIFWDGTELVNSTELLSDFDVADVNGDGLVLGAGNWPIATGAFFDTFTDLLANGGVTVVVELTIDGQYNIGTGSQFATGPIMQIMDGTDADLTTNAIYADIYDGFHLYVGDSNDLTEVGGDVDTAQPAGIERRAFTLFRDLGGGSWQTASTTNGGPAQSTTTSHGGGYFTVVEIDVFGVESWTYPLEKARVRRLTVYEAKTPAEIDAATDISDWPQWIAYTTNSSGPAATSHPVTAPAHETGDLIIVFAAFDGTPTISIASGTGWTIGDQQVSNGQVVGAWIWKIADGSDTLTLGSSDSEKMSYVAMSYRNAAAFEAAFTTGTTADAQSPSFSPSGGAGKYAFVSVIMTDGSAGTPAAPPANMSRYMSQVGTSDGGSVYYADKWVDGDGFAPAAFDLTAQEWVGFTLALHA